MRSEKSPTDRLELFRGPLRHYLIGFMLRFLQEPLVQCVEPVELRDPLLQRETAQGRASYKPNALAIAALSSSAFVKGSIFAYVILLLSVSSAWSILNSLMTASRTNA